MKETPTKMFVKKGVLDINQDILVKKAIVVPNSSRFQVAYTADKNRILKQIFPESKKLSYNGQGSKDGSKDMSDFERSQKAHIIKNLTKKIIINNEKFRKNKNKDGLGK